MPSLLWPSAQSGLATVATAVTNSASTNLRAQTTPTLLRGSMESIRIMALPCVAGRLRGILKAEECRSGEG